MKTINEGEPAPFDGYVITHQEYNKILSDKELLNWLNKKLKIINSKAQ